MSYIFLKTIKGSKSEHRISAKLNLNRDRDMFMSKVLNRKMFVGPIYFLKILKNKVTVISYNFCFSYSVVISMSS